MKNKRRVNTNSKDLREKWAKFTGLLYGLSRSEKIPSFDIHTLNKLLRIYKPKYVVDYINSDDEYVQEYNLNINSGGMQLKGNKIHYIWDFPPIVPVARYIRIIHSKESLYLEICFRPQGSIDEAFIEEEYYTLEVNLESLKTECFYSINGSKTEIPDDTFWKHFTDGINDFETEEKHYLSALTPVLNSLRETEGKRFK